MNPQLFDALVDLVNPKLRHWTPPPGAYAFEDFHPDFEERAAERLRGLMAELAGRSTEGAGPSDAVAEQRVAARVAVLVAEKLSPAPAPDVETASGPGPGATANVRGPKALAPRPREREPYRPTVKPSETDRAAARRVLVRAGLASTGRRS